MEDYKEETTIDAVRIEPCIACGKSYLGEIASVGSLFFANFTYLLFRCENSKCMNHAWAVKDRKKLVEHENHTEAFPLVLVSRQPKSPRKLLIPYSSPIKSYSELPKNIIHDFDQAYKCLIAEYYDASACLFRRTLEGVLIDKGANPKDRLIDMLRKLEGTGKLPPEASQLCDDVKCWGNEGAHSRSPITAKDADLACMFTDILIAWLYGHVKPAINKNPAQ